MDTDLWLLLLRLGFLALLYLFLFQLVVLLRRSLTVDERAAKRRDVATSTPRLVVVESSLPSLPRGHSFPLKEMTTIGRSPGNVLVIEDPFVSAEHALISVRDGNLWIEDLGSTNGTFVNRRQIAVPTLIQPGDVIQVGQAKLKLMR